MIEQNRQDRNIVKCITRDMSPLPSPEKVDLNLARLVLEVVVGIHENTFTETSDLTKVGNYDNTYVQSALNLISQNIVYAHLNETFLGTETCRKQTTCGELSLRVFHRLDDHLQGMEPESLYMSLIKNHRYILESEVPLTQSESWIRQDSVRFSDFRQGINVTSLFDIRRNFSLDKYRRIWRGMRWLSANMLGWDGEFKLPEDLDQHVLAKTTS